MRIDHPHLWGVLHRLHLAHDADPSKLEEWRRTPESEGQIQDLAQSGSYAEGYSYLQNEVFPPSYIRKR
jgi:hypothetical protein